MKVSLLLSTALRGDETLSERTIRWIELNWQKGDENFIDGTIGLYVNFASNTAARGFLSSKLAQEEGMTVRNELQDALDNDLLKI